MKLSTLGHRKFNQLYNRRRKQGLTHENIADSLGVERGYITMILSNKRSPSIELASKIEIIYQIPIRDWTVRMAPK